MSTPNLRSDEAKQVSRESLTTRARLVGQFCDMSDVCGPGNRRCMSGPAGRHLGYTEPQVLHAAFRAVVSTGEDHAVKGLTSLVSPDRASRLFSVCCDLLGPGAVLYRVRQDR